MRLLSLILFLVICLVGYVGVGPFLTLNSIKNAVETSDSVQLSEDIDFPAVRQNIKEQFSTVMASKASSELSDNPFAALAVAFPTSWLRAYSIPSLLRPVSPHF